MFKIMITAPSSGSGKTVVTCGMLSVLRRRGADPCAFKCGPDYIDPMFHRSVMGINSGNIDTFLAGDAGAKAIFEAGIRGCGAAVCEGVMGYYDGVAGGTDASAWHVTELLDMPAVLVIRPGGASITLAAIIKGINEFRSPGRICGVILNDCDERIYDRYSRQIEQESEVAVLGYVPHMAEAAFDSRHLGLMTAAEIADIGGRIERIGERMEQTVDIDRLIRAAGDICADDAAADEDQMHHKARIAVAADEAFCFVYDASLRAIEAAGGEVIRFSPVHDMVLPGGIDGLYIPGGYPELYGRELEANSSMRGSVRTAVRAGMPTIAECGGFMYLMESMNGSDGRTYDMAGALPGSSSSAGRLVRFGYGYIDADEDSMMFRCGERVPVHEFHYWDADANGDDLLMNKCASGETYRCGYATDTLYAGFPHLYLAGQADLAGRFVSAAARYREHTKGESDAVLADI